ncbi:uncharacterized protein LOC126572378 [Anopheles aquasalis]|uniref:uncharacterized protein LOC126572378 n=1 Tax=Anopheles aquasalis TaxID=42839 RepID=UPI00215B0C5A|nr:uncharacterized protein LOC126572378 [Anopheles aquasalis]
MSGKRKPTERVADPTSTAYSERLHGTEEEYDHRIVDPQQHIQKRCKRYFKFGAILEGISTLTDIQQQDLVTGGPSQYQDQSSGHGLDYHAAHVIRVGEINEELKSDHRPLYNALANFLGHTQVVAREANLWRGIGGSIDRAQSDRLILLSRVRFRGLMDGSNQSAIRMVLRMLEKAIKDHVELSSAAMEWLKESFKDEGVLELFKYGKEVYNSVVNGEFLKRYANPQ